MKKNLLTIITLLLAATTGLTSCSNPSPAETPPAQDAALQPSQGNQNEQQETLWQEKKPDHYTIRVQEISMWHMQTIQVEFDQDQVVSHFAACSPAPIESDHCSIQEYDPASYRVENLFAMARQAAANASDSVSISITYDAAYGFPNQIHVHNQKATDADTTFNVLSFSVESEQPPVEPISGHEFQHWLPGEDTGFLQSPPDKIWTYGEELWLLEPGGLHVYRDGYWQQALGLSDGQFLGMDSTGTALILDGGASLFFYNLNDQSLYINQGLVNQWDEAGDDRWHPDPMPVITTAGDGRLWLTLGEPVIRRYDPSTRTWESISAQDVGLETAGDDPAPYFTDSVITDDQTVWVSACGKSGQDYAGGGLFTYINDEWVEIAQTVNICINDLEVDAQGRLWAAGTDRMWIFDPQNQTWNHTLLPSETGGLALNLEIQADGTLWLEMFTFPTNGMPVRSLLRQYEGQWSLIAGNLLAPVSITGLEQNDVWLTANGIIYHVQGTQTEMPDQLDGMNMQIQSISGEQIWLAVLDGGDAGLWLYEAAEN